MSTSTDNNTTFTAAILLGSDDYPQFEKLNAGPLFKNSSRAFANYLQDENIGLRVHMTLDLFAFEGNADLQLGEIRTFLERVKRESQEFEFVNVIIHYVGHGVIATSQTKEFAFAIKATESAFPMGTSLNVAKLARAVVEANPHIRTFVIVDCCFGGEAARYFLSEIPNQGCGVLAASDPQNPAIAMNGEEFTRFGGALLKALRTGDERYPEFLSLSDIGDLAWATLRKDPDNALPFAAGAESTKGDITAKARIFPNRAHPLFATSGTAHVRSGCFRVAHLSDLHFGASFDQASVWESLRQYLESKNLDLLLITGDIVQSPTEENLSYAKEQLDQLRVSYYVCPGNSDHHGSARSSRSFDSKFAENLVKPGEVGRPTLKCGDNEWKLAILSLDTSPSRRDSQRGCVNPDELTNVERAAEKVEPDTDLCIVLQHHQLLPIAELQKEGQAGAAAHPMMKDAGILLERLSELNVNLALHGHEHRSFAARFAKANCKWNDVTIVAAASASGFNAQNACRPADASFNMLEFRDDGTVWIEQHSMEHEKWAATSGGPSQLYSRADVRKIRLRRSHHEPSNFRVVKRFAFSKSRDIRVREVRVPCALDSGTFRYEVINSTGFPTCNGVTVEWGDGHKERFVPKYMYAGHDHTYCFELTLTRSDPVARSVTIDTLWEFGGLLTRDDLNMLGSNAPIGERRTKGQEFVSARVTDSLEELMLVVLLPKDVAPKIEDIEVIVESLDSGEEHPTSNVTKLKPLELGRGSFVLAVPSPFPAMRYGLAWHLAALPRKGPTFATFKDIAKDNAEELLVAFRDTLPSHLRTYSSASLYISRPEKNPPMWQRALCLTRDKHKEQSYSELFVNDPQSIYRMCWWGKLAVLKPPYALCPDGTEKRPMELQGDEKAVITVPIRPSGLPEIYEPAAMVRLGYNHAPRLDGDASVLESISDAATSLLNRYVTLKMEQTNDSRI